MPADVAAHLDPDLRPEARPRAPGWRPSFGQAGAAQAHLARQGVRPGDLFLFFGWFRHAENVRGQHRFRDDAEDFHALFGWLQIGEVLVAGPDAALPAWVADHPHARHRYDGQSVLYTAATTLELDGTSGDLPGAGTFARFAPELALTMVDPTTGRFARRSRWSLPRCFLPPSGPRLTYHFAPARWRSDVENPERVRLDVVARGQEFVFDATDCPEAAAWAAALIERHGRTPSELHGRRLLLMVRELHRQGFERLRIAPGLAPSGTAWRCDIVPAEQTCRENGALVPPGTQTEAHYSTGMGGRYFEWPDAADDTPAQLAEKFVSRFPALAAAGRGADRGYAAWYREMIEATAPMGLLYAYWDSYGDWRPDLPQLRTTMETQVPAPPSGPSVYRSS